MSCFRSSYRKSRRKSTPAETSGIFHSVSPCLYVCLHVCLSPIVLISLSVALHLSLLQLIYCLHQLHDLKVHCLKDFSRSPFAFRSPFTQPAAQGGLQLMQLRLLQEELSFTAHTLIMNADALKFVCVG